MRREDATDLRLPNGVVVPAMLRTSELSLRQKKEHVEGQKWRMTYELARKCGYGEAEILAVLGPDASVSGAPT